MNEDFEWVARIIESCKTGFHISCIPAMIDLFDQKHHDEHHKNVLLNYLMDQESKINVDA